MPDGRQIYQYSHEGIATIEVLNAIAKGEDPELVTERISAEIENMMGIDNAYASRGLFINPILRWPGGTVYYSFQSNLRTEYRTATRNAMNSWETGSGNKVKFVYVDYNDSMTLIAKLLGVPLLSIGQKDLNGASGVATPGSPLSLGIMCLVYSYMYFDNNVNIGTTEVYDTKNAYSVALHELGHVLGLQHEHQRKDRDNYIKVTNSGSDYNKLSEITLYSLNINTIWKTKKILFVTVSYPVIVITTTAHPQFQKTSNFDFMSVMIYNNLEIIHPSYMNTSYGKISTTTGKYVTINTTRLSASDKAFIKQLY